MSKELLRGLVDKIAEPFWKSVYDGHQGYLARLLEEFKEKAARDDGLFTRPWDVFRGNRNSSEAARTVDRMVERTGNGMRDPVKLRTDLDKVFDALSKRHAEDVLASFKAKLMRKLNGVVGGAGVEGEIRGDLGRNRIRLREVGTGLTFTVYSQVVSVWPCWARPHHRYPTTFHDVSVNGKLVGKKLSEEEIKKLSAELRGKEFVPTAEKKRTEVKNRREAQRAAKLEKDLTKARGALQRALNRCERAAVDYELFGAKRDHEEAHAKLLRLLKRNELPQDGEELLTEEPKLSLDNADAAPAKLKSMRKALREAKKSLAQYEAGNGMGSPDPDFQKRVAGSIKKNIVEYEAGLAKLEGLVKKAS